jgi:lipopolysaccharide export LptBFGC system permease protein LptF
MLGKMAWRNLTAEEDATRPEARLGGALLWMTIAALALCVVALAAACFAFDRLREIGGRYMIAVAFIVAWSITFIVMTLLRARATPVVASVGLAVWVAYRFCVSLLAEAGWPLAVDLLGEAVMLAAFCGYMAGGVRPNAYYRRRLPAA